MPLEKTFQAFLAVSQRGAGHDSKETGKAAYK